jgi:hypothetical protein
MTLLAVVGAKGAPGATTAAVALALGWPRPVLLVDADPAGGDIAPGWLGGRVGLDRGLLSWAAATRHTPAATAADLAPHTTAIPDAPGVLVLPGLAHAGQTGGLEEATWLRLVTSAAAPWPAPPTPRATAGQGRGPEPGALAVDLLADCGRICPVTPWPLIIAAGLVLLAARPSLRGVQHARHAAATLTAVTGPAGGAVQLVVCGPGPYEPRAVERAVGLPVAAVLPDDPRAAAVLSDGAPAGRGWERTALARTARSAARHLAHDLAAHDLAAHDLAADPTQTGISVPRAPYGDAGPRTPPASVAGWAAPPAAGTRTTP